jgi:hypothetical protein
MLSGLRTLRAFGPPQYVMISASFGTDVVAWPMVSSGIRVEPGMISPVKYWLVNTFQKCAMSPWSSRCRSSSVEIVRASSMSLSSSIGSMMLVDSAHGITISKRQAGQNGCENHARAPRSAMNRLQNVMGCFRMKCDARDRESLSIRIGLPPTRATTPCPSVPAGVPVL